MEEKRKRRWVLPALCAAVAVALCGCSGELSDDSVTVKQYKGLEIAQVEKSEVTDGDVESTIQSYLNASREKETVTGRAAELGDTVDVDYVGTLDGVAFDGGTAEGASIVLGEGKFIQASGEYKGFEEQIVGHSTGEEFDITVRFPENYRAKEMAGQAAVFHITLNEISRESDETPELTDEWVQTVSQKSETAEEFREEIRENMEARSDQDYKNTLQESLMDALLAQVEVKEYPEGALEEEQQEIEARIRGQAESLGMEFADYLQNFYGMTEEEFSQKVQETAESAVKQRLACELIAKKEHLEPSEEEYAEKEKEYAENAGYDSVEAFREDYGTKTIRNTALQQAVLEYLADQCVQVKG